VNYVCSLCICAFWRAVDVGCCRTVAPLTALAVTHPHTSTLFSPRTGQANKEREAAAQAAAQAAEAESRALAAQAQVVAAAAAAAAAAAQPAPALLTVPTTAPAPAPAPAPDAAPKKVMDNVVHYELMHEEAAAAAGIVAEQAIALADKYKEEAEVWRRKYEAVAAAAPLGPAQPPASAATTAAAAPALSISLPADPAAGAATMEAQAAKPPSPRAVMASMMAPAFPAPAPAASAAAAPATLPSMAIPGEGADDTDVAPTSQPDQMSVASAQPSAATSATGPDARPGTPHAPLGFRSYVSTPGVAGPGVDREPAFTFEETATAQPQLCCTVA